jgi:hypothetical protein
LPFLNALKIHGLLDAERLFRRLVVMPREMDRLWLLATGCASASIS